jgi:hypothetical protein
MAIDYTGMFTGKRPDPSAGVAGMPRDLLGQTLQGIQQGEQRSRQALGQMMGKDLRSSADQAREQLSQVDINSVNTPEGLLKLAQLQQATGDTAGAATLASQAEALRQKNTAKETAVDRQKAFAVYARKTHGDDVGDLADSGAITPKDLSGLLNKGNANGKSKGTSFQIQDENGDIFAATTLVDLDSSTIDVVYSNISPDSKSKSPVGKVERIGGAYGLTSEQAAQVKVDSSGKIEAAQQLSQLKTKASDEYGKVNAAVSTGNRMLSILENINTGGMTPVVSKQILDLFGKTATDVSEFNNLAGQMMLASLSAFGTNPTEGERAVAATLQASLDKGEGVNAAIINRFLEEQNLKRLRLQNLLSPDTKTLDDYNSFVVGQYKEDTDEVPAPVGPIIDFNDLN